MYKKLYEEEQKLRSHPQEIVPGFSYVESSIYLAPLLSLLYIVKFLIIRHFPCEVSKILVNS